MLRFGDAVTVRFTTGGSEMVCTGPAQAGELTVTAGNLTWLWDAPDAAAFLSAPVEGASQPFRIQQAGQLSRPGVFLWGQTITLYLK